MALRRLVRLHVRSLQDETGKADDVNNVKVMRRLQSKTMLMAEKPVTEPLNQKMILN